MDSLMNNLRILIITIFVIGCRACDIKTCDRPDNVTLNCENNNCVAIPSDETAKVVELAHNKIKEVRTLNLPKAEEIDLSYNSIEAIQDEAFSICKQLARLNLAHNLVKRLEPAMFRNLENLRYLDISYNKIDQVQNDVFPMTTIDNLDTLDLSHNEMSYIHPEAFFSLNSLKDIHLEHNNLDDRTVTATFFAQLLDLERLYINNNKITVLESDLFYGVFPLVEVDLSSNLIENISNSSFSELDDLRKVNLRWNKIKVLEPNTFNQENLEDLYLDNNEFEEILPSFFEGCNAKKLSLQGLDKLAHVRNGSFAGMPRLETIEISHCGILETIEPDAFGMDTSTVKVADLSMNSLRYLAAETLPWGQVRADLSNNPWNCDCGLEWMKEVQINYIHGNYTKCATPKELRNKIIKEVPYDYFTCSRVHLTAMRQTSFLRRKGSMLIGGLIILGVLFVTGVIVAVWGRRRRLLSQQSTTGYKALYNAVDSEDASMNVELTYTEKSKLSKEPAPVDV